MNGSTRRGSAGPRVFAAAAVIMLAALAAAAPARAATVSGQDVPGQQVAAALRRSPLYVDPSLASAFPASARRSLLAAIRKAPATVFILAVPLVSGSQWATGEQLADVAQSALGEPGIYLTLDASFSSLIDAYTYPSDPQGLDAPPYHAADAALAANLAPDDQDAPVWQVFARCIQLISSGRAVSAYQALASPAPAPSSSSASTDGGAAATGATFAAAAVAAVTAIRLRKRRRRRRGAQAQALPPLPYAVTAAARAATEADLRDRAQQELIDLSQMLERAETPGGPDADKAEKDLARALDAYAAAAQVLDSASGIPDLAGVLVLTHLGRCAAAAAQARLTGQPAPAATLLCFFSPLHGEGTQLTRWRLRGGQQVLDVHACGDCAAALTRRQFPAVLTVTSGGYDVPYYETASVWAATGYGQFGTDLIKTILAGGPHPGQQR